MGLPLLKEHEAKLSWLSDDARKVIAEHDIKVYALPHHYESKCGFMCCGKTKAGNTYIAMFQTDILQAKLTYAETECMIWHELGHILHDMTEIEADYFAMAHTSYEVWKSTIQKAFKVRSGTITSHYKHRWAALQ